MNYVILTKPPMSINTALTAFAASHCQHVNAEIKSANCISRTDCLREQEIIYDAGRHVIMVNIDSALWTVFPLK
jgi:hypothetical protein